MIKAVARVIVFPINDLEVFYDENGVIYFDGALLAIEDDCFFVLPEVHATVDENAIAFTEVFSDRFSTTAPSFTTEPGDSLYFVSGFRFVAFVYGDVEMGDGGFGEGVTGDGIITETTEDGDLV